MKTKKEWRLNDMKKKKELEICKTFIYLMLIYFLIVAISIMMFQELIIKLIERGYINQIIVIALGVILATQFICFIILLIYTWYNSEEA